MAADGSFSIRVGMNVSSATNALAKLDKQIQKSTATVGELQNRLDELGSAKIPTAEYAKLQKQLEAAQNELDKLVEKENEFIDLGDHSSDMYNGVLDQEEKVIQKMDEIRAKMKSLSDSGNAFTPGTSTQEYKDTASQLAAAQSNVAGLTKQAGLGEVVAGFSRVSQIAQGINQVFGALESGLKKMLDVVQKVGSIGADAMKKITSSATKAARAITSKLVSAAQSAGKALQKMADSQIQKAFKNLSSGITPLISGVEKFGKRIASLATRAFIFSVISSMFKDMREEFENAFTAYKKNDADFLAQINSLKTALANLGASIVSAFQPILSAVIPILTQLISWLTTAVNAIGMFFAALTGHNTYKKLTADITAAGAAADETGKKVKSAGDKAKKAALGLQKFDELNNLTNTSSGSGSSGSGSGSSDNFSYSMEEVPIASDIMDLAKMDPKELGYTLSEKLADALDEIKWPEIQAKANDAGTKLAGFLNGAFSNIHFSTSLGTTVGEALNTVSEAVNGFMATFSFDDFGVWLGTSWNSVVGTIKWSLLADNIVLAMNGAVAALDSFFTTIESTCYGLGNNLGGVVTEVLARFDLTALGKAINDAALDFTLALEGFNAAISTGIPQISNNLAGGINMVISGMAIGQDGEIYNVWAENGTAVGEAIDNFAAIIAQTCEQIQFYDLGTQLATWLQNAITAIDPNNFQGAIDGVISGIFDTFYGFTMNFPVAELANAISGCINKAIQDFDPQKAAAAITKAVKNIMNFFISAIEQTDWKQLGDKISTFLGEIDWAGIIQRIGTLISTATTNMPFEEIVTAFVGVFEEVFEAIDWEEVGSAINTLTEGLITKLCEYLGDPENRETFVTALSDFFDGLDIAGIIHSVNWLVLQILGMFMETVSAMNWGDIGSILMEAFMLGITNFPIIGPIVKAIGYLILTLTTVVYKGLSQVASLGKDIAEGIATGISDFFTTIGTWLREHVFDPFIKWFKELFGIHSPSTVMAEQGGYLIEGLLQGISDTWHTITEFFSTTIENLIELVKGLLSGITTKIIEIGEDMKTAWYDVWQAIHDKLDEIWGKIKDIVETTFGDIKDFIETTIGNIQTTWDNVWQAIHDFANDIWQKIQEFIDDTINGVHDTIDDVLDKIQGTWESTWQAVKDFVDPIWQWVTDTIDTIFGDGSTSIGTKISDALDNIKDKWEDIWGGMKDFLKGIINGIIGFINKMISGVESGINAVINGINSLSFDVPDWVPAIGGSHFGFSLGTVSLGRIPELANGAVIRGGNPFMAMLGDQPAGQTNIEAPLDTITEAVRGAQADEIVVLQEQNAILRQILSRSGILQRDIFNAVVDENNSYISRNGRSAFAY